MSDRGVKQSVDVRKLAAFFGVAERTAYRWARTGLPSNVRHILECVLAGDFLPPEWKRAGLKISPDRVHLASGHHVSVQVIKFWPFLAQCVDWTKAAKLLSGTSFTGGY